MEGSEDDGHVMCFEIWEEEGSESDADGTSDLSFGWESDEESRDGINWWLEEQTEDECNGPQQEDRSWPRQATKVRLTGSKRKWGRSFGGVKKRIMKSRVGQNYA